MADGSIPTTFANSTAKERGNQRFVSMIAQLQLMANCDLVEIVATGANANTAPSKFEFDLVFEHGDSVLVTNDESNPGEVLTGIDAIKRCIARMMIEDREDFSDIYDPTESTTPTNDESIPRVGVRIAHMITGQLVNNLTSGEENITVSTN